MSFDFYMSIQSVRQSKFYPPPSSPLPHTLHIKLPDCRLTCKRWNLGIWRITRAPLTHTFTHRCNHTHTQRVYTTRARVYMQCAFCIRCSLYFIELARVRAAAANALSLFKLMLSWSGCYSRLICVPRINTRHLIILLVFGEKCVLQVSIAIFTSFGRNIIFDYCGGGDKQRKSRKSLPSIIR